MKGSGAAGAAITFVTAMPTGTGSAAGLELAARATVEMEPASTYRATLDAKSDSPLARAILTRAVREWAPSPDLRLEARVVSPIPAGRGLKSSSAVSGALALAVAQALGRKVSALEVAQMTSAVAQSIGQSATGAFDDCLAGLWPGIHVTDNRLRRLLRTDPIHPDWQVLLWVPNSEHRPSPELVSAFLPEVAEGMEAVRLAEEGHSLEALALNTALVERVLGYPYALLRRRLVDAGARACGVSGLGPTLAVIVSGSKIDSARAVLSLEPGRLLQTSFRREPTPGVTGLA